MSKRVRSKKERLRRKKRRSKMLQSFYLCLFISIVIILTYLIIYIPMAINYLDPFLNPLGELFFGGESFYITIRNLWAMKLGIITLVDVLTAFQLSLFFGFMFIGFANLMEYKRRKAGLFSMVFFISGTILLTLIYAYASSSAVMPVFTSLGCILTVLYLYAVQT